MLLLQVSLQRFKVPGLARTIVKVELADKDVHLIVRGDTTEVRGCGAQAGEGSRWATAGLQTNVGGQELETLLSRLLRE